MSGSTQPQRRPEIRSDTRNLSSRSPSRRGAVIVEFALAFTIFFLVTVVGILDFGRGIWAYNLLAHAAHQGARYALVRGSSSLSPATKDDIRNYVRAQAAMLDPAKVEVTPSWVPNNDPSSFVEIQVQYDFKPLFGQFFGVTIPLSSTARVVIAQ